MRNLWLPKCNVYLQTWTEFNMILSNNLVLNNLLIRASFASSVITHIKFDTQCWISTAYSLRKVLITPTDARDPNSPKHKNQASNFNRSYQYPSISRIIMRSLIPVCGSHKIGFVTPLLVALQFNSVFVLTSNLHYNWKEEIPSTRTCWMNS